LILMNYYNVYQHYTILDINRLRKVPGILLWIIIIITANFVIIALLKLFLSLFVIPVGMDYSSNLLNAKEILLPMI
jgi:hypothetical protein